MHSQQPIAVTVRKNILRAVQELGLGEFISPDLLDSGLDDLELGLGQLLADVERADRRGIRLSDAVHAHERFPYLARAHGFMCDVYLAEVPAELLPWVRAITRMETPVWAIESSNALCVVARSSRAAAEERALARLVIFEGLRLNLFLAAWKTRGGFEGLGGCGRDLDEFADRQLSSMLAIPLAEDATEDYRPFDTVVASAIVELREHMDRLWAAQSLIEELRKACADAACLEQLLRKADPVDAVVLRNKFSRAHHQQPIPVARLPLEHPLILHGHNENSLNQRASRATQALKKSKTALTVRPATNLLADVLTENQENVDAK